MGGLAYNLVPPLKRDIQRAAGALVALGALVVLFSIIAPGFLSWSNVSKLALQSVILLVLAIGQTLVILTEGIDLSGGAVLTAVGVIAALAFQAGLGVWAIPLALAVSLVFGLLNGILVSRAKFAPFLVTLGSMSMAQGLSLVLTRGGSVPNLPAWFQLLYNGFFLGIPVPAWISLIMVVGAFFLLNATPFGFAISALGGNRDAARFSGIHEGRYELAVYVISGLCAGLAGLIMASRLNAGHPTVGFGLEFEAIAAVIIGGTSFAKANGGIIGTVVGVALIAVLRSGMNLMGLDPFLQLPAIGSTIILAVAASTILSRRRTGGV